MDKYQLNKNTFNNLATEYQDSYMDYEGYTDTFDLFIAEIENENAKILEIACGPGNVTKYLLNHKPLYKIYGIDVAPKMIELARKNNASAKYDIMDCRDISQISDRFDAVMCAFGLPYLTQKDTTKLISDSASMLTPNGIIYLSTMIGNYADSEYVESKKHNQQTFVHYHDKGMLKNTLLENDFTIVHESLQPYVDNAGKQFTDLFLIAKWK